MPKPMCKTTAHKPLPITATEQSRKRATAINRKEYHAKQSPVRKQVCTCRDDKRQGVLRSQRRLAKEEALELPWKNSYKLGM